MQKYFQLLLGFLFLSVLFSFSVFAFRDNLLTTSAFAISTFPIDQRAAPDCSFQDLTLSLASKLNLPVSSFYVNTLTPLDQRYLRLTLHNYQTSQNELYLYDLGADATWQTADDRTFFLDTMNSFPPVTFLVLNGTYNFFWTNAQPTTAQFYDLKQCTLLTTGCSHQLLTKIPYSVRILAGSSLHNRLYLEIISSPDSFVSCSLSPTAADSCTNSFSTFVNHLSLSPRLSDVHSIPNTGFVYNKSGQETFFSLYSQSEVPLPSGVVLSSFTVLAPSVPLLTAVRISPVSSRTDLLLLDAVTGNSLGVFDTLSVSAPTSPPYAVVNGSTVYAQGSNLYGKRRNLLALSLLQESLAQETELTVVPNSLGTYSVTYVVAGKLLQTGCSF